MRTTHFIMLLSAALIFPSAAMTAVETPPAVSVQAADLQPLEAALADYRALAEQGGWPKLNASDKKIAPDAKDARIPVIREILTKTGDYTGYDNSPIYDVDLQAAVKSFQERHGLNNDGVIGKTTLEALAVPVEQRIAQIEGTLKRMAAFEAPSGRYLLVNLPEYRLRGYNDGALALDMRVIVGAPKNPTPTFDNHITYVSFNPHWGVPAKIAANELLPKILKNPDYVKENNYAVYNMSAEGYEEVDPTSIDWGSMNRHSFHYQLRQRPGKGNALGKIKFGMVGTDDIYLHDTANHSLFAKDDRALSHGCIRVERPHDLAHYVLSGTEHFDNEKIDALYNSDDSKTVNIPGVAVHVVYWTASVDQASGKLHFSKDVYGLDRI